MDKPDTPKDRVEDGGLATWLRLLASKRDGADTGCTDARAWWKTARRLNGG